MIRVLDELLWALRRAGFPISTAQAIDVAEVVRLVGFDDPAVLRDAIAAVVVERAADVPRYRRAFHRFFDPIRAYPDDLWGRLRARGFTRAELDALRELLDGAAQRSGLGDAAAFVALTGTEGELDQVLAAADIRRTLAPLSSPLQTGYFAHKAMDRLLVPQVASAMKRIGDVLREGLGERGASLGRALADEVADLRRRVREHVDSAARRAQLGDDDEGPRRLADKAFSSLTEAEIAEVRRAVQRLAERLRGAERVRRRHALRGRIDVRRTMRESLRTGGVPFAPARLRKRRDRPRLFVLCDVSESVRTASLFMLEFVHSVQQLFAGTRTFVFVSELGETTELFARSSTRSALARVYGGGVVSGADNSNYGRAFRMFEARCGRDLDRRATVVILGDGRTNHHADEARLVERWRDRSRSVLWICPEAEGSWASGDSAMVRYAAASTEVVRARTAAELEAAARRLIAR